MSNSTYVNFARSAWDSYARGLSTHSVIQAWRYHAHILRATWNVLSNSLDDDRRDIALLCCSGAIYGLPRRRVKRGTGLKPMLPAWPRWLYRIRSLERVGILQRPKRRL